MIRCHSLRGAFAAAIIIFSCSAATSAPAPSFSWTGVYLGAHFGYFRGLGIGDVPPDVIPTGVFGGGQVGYNYQLPNNIVLGIEADISHGGGGIHGANFGYGTYVDTFGSIRGRIGYTFGRTLAYGTGGFAWGHLKNFDDEGHIAKNTLTGWTAGGGLEHAFTNRVSVKIEYLGLEYGKKNFVFVAPDGIANMGLIAHQVRLGINFRLTP